MSAGATDTTLSDRDIELRVEFFDTAMEGLERAEEKRLESFAYTPIGHILKAFATACKAPDNNLSVQSDIQPKLKGPNGTHCSPDFGAVLIPKRASKRDRSEPLPKEDLLSLWEVKTFTEGAWFIDNLEDHEIVTNQAKQNLTSYLRQLNQQALFAFNEYHDCDTVPVFLSQGNYFTFLLYDRPSNWDAIMTKSIQVSSPALSQSAATGQPEQRGSDTATSQEPEPPSLPQDQAAPSNSQSQGAPSSMQDQEALSGAQEEETPSGRQETIAAQEAVVDTAVTAADQDARTPGCDRDPNAEEQGPTRLAAEGKDDDKGAAASTADAPTTSTESTEPEWEYGDYLIPRLVFSCEYILLPDGSGFTPQFLKALRTAMDFRGVTFKPSDCLFRLPDDLQLDDVSITQSLDDAQAAIDEFKAEQEARKLADQSFSTASTASVHSEYKNWRTAIVRPDNGKLWKLRRRQITYKSPKPQRKVANRDILRHLVAEAPGPKPPKASKEARPGHSQDAPTAHAHVNAVAGPSTARVPLLHQRPAKCGTQNAGPSQKRKLEQAQDEPAAAVPADEHADSSKTRGRAPRGHPIRSAVQAAGPSKKCKLESSGDVPADDARVDDTTAGPVTGPSDEQLTGGSAEASTGNAKKPGQASRKGKERAH
ncbi:hypothetical protein EWM64_g1773 [Hericium alpestre]|uniref:Uncharacterized protein n=1 Tax=Hericium alpestre TaxID=135208 RepID=A0A4Z0A6X8_9AGAM|nr:hypothetical protein EWM64_g1773 [Hericium alpestre]